MEGVQLFLLTILVALLLSGGIVWLGKRRAARPDAKLEALAGYDFPAELDVLLARKRPHYSARQRELAFEALREFFCLLYLEQRAGRRASLGMPSALADDAWHTFILWTRAYEAFCKRFFGTLVHHAPDPVAAPRPMSEATVFKADVQRTWAAYRRHAGPHAHCFREAHLAGVAAPLLFALDASAGVPGWIWTPEALARLDEAARALAAAKQDSGSSCGGSTSGMNDDGDGDGGSCGGCGGD